MKKYYICADLYGYAEVEAENEEQAWEKASALTIHDFDISNCVYDISFVEEEEC